MSDKKTFLLLTAQAQAKVPQQAVLAQYLGQPTADAAAKVQAITAVYDQLDIRNQTEARINEYFHGALLHLDRVMVPAPRKAILRQWALELMARES
jgi:geranylgeranyl diphosphate synthase type II